MTSLKCVVVGDPSSEKTKSMMSFSSNQALENVTSIVFDNYEIKFLFDGEMVQLCLWDTPPQASLSNLRVLAYPETDVFIIMYSMLDIEGYSNAVNRWLPEILKNSLNAPIILAGNTLVPQSENQVMRPGVNRVGSLHGISEHFIFSSYNSASIEDLFKKTARKALEIKNNPKNNVENTLELEAELQVF